MTPHKTPIIAVTPELRVRRAKKLALDAIRDARLVHDNLELDRSTRTRMSYKIRSEALAAVLDVLSARSHH
jgi:hypothetical protein